MDPLVALLAQPLRLSSALDLLSRITLLEDATRACRAELQRRPSHCQVEPPLPDPAAASSVDSIVNVLDPLCLQQVAAGALWERLIGFSSRLASFFWL